MKKRRRGEEEEEVGARIEDFEFFLLQFSWVFNLEVWDPLSLIILPFKELNSNDSKFFQKHKNPNFDSKHEFLH